MTSCTPRKTRSTAPRSARAAFDRGEPASLRPPGSRGAVSLSGRWRGAILGNPLQPDLPPIRKHRSGTKHSVRTVSRLADDRIENDAGVLHLHHLRRALV